MKFDKQKAIIVLLVILIVLMLGYIGRDVYLGMQSNLMLRGYEVAVEDLMNEAKNEECAPFPIYMDDEAVQLINVECLEGDVGVEEPAPQQEGMMPEGDIMPEEEMMEEGLE